MKAKNFTNLEINQTIYDNQSGLILDVIAPFEEIENKYSTEGQQGYIECLNALRQGRTDYEETRYKIELSDHRHWNVFKVGDIDKISNHKLYKEMIIYQLENNTTLIHWIIDSLSPEADINLNRFF